VSSSTSILQRIARGDPAAVRECIDRYGALVWSLARRFSPNAADAEDVAQDIFVALWESAARFDPAQAEEATFVAMIARRRLIDRQRRRARRVDTDPLPEVPSLPELSTHPRAELCAEANLAVRAVRQLRPAQQQVLLLNTCHGLSHEEIADATGMPLGTVKAHARRGLVRVREILDTKRDTGGGAGS
jgi:RNA polymerase sigma-70 factor (ECF subfamily)